MSDTIIKHELGVDKVKTTLFVIGQTIFKHNLV